MTEEILNTLEDEQGDSRGLRCDEELLGIRLTLLEWIVPPELRVPLVEGVTFWQFEKEFDIDNCDGECPSDEEDDGGDDDDDDDEVPLNVGDAHPPPAGKLYVEDEVEDTLDELETRWWLIPRGLGVGGKLTEHSPCNVSPLSCEVEETKE